MTKPVLLFILFLSLWGCSDSSIDSDKPKSSGNIDEILLVADTITWQSETGESIRKTVREAHPGVINPEPFFKISFFPEEHFGGIFTKHHFIFIPTTLERISLNPLFNRLIPSRVIEKVNTSSNHLFYKQKDVFARGQTILFLITKENYYLNQDFITHKKQIQEVLCTELISQHISALHQKPTNKLLDWLLHKEENISLHLPEGFEIALQEKGILWFRNVTEEADLNVFFTSKTYNGESDFNIDTILAWRDTITHQYIFADKQDTSFMERETIVPPLVKTEVDSTNYSTYLWGLWKMKNRAMGGSYVSRTVKSTHNDQIYYIEGFVYAPGQEKLNYIRSLEAIIRTFEPGKLDE